MKYHVDYEVFSRADLKVVGAYRYAEDPSTEVLVLAISSDTEGPYLWVHPLWRKVVPSDPNAARLLARITSQDEVWAHSATFEIAVTRYARNGPLGHVELHQWRCTAALARSAGYPSALEKVAELLELPEKKDPAGNRLIALLCKPNKHGQRVTPAVRPDEFRKLGAYCLQDVRVERAIHAKLRPFEFTGSMLQAWLFDVRMNDRGFPVNRAALHHARKLVLEASTAVVKEFRALTGLNPTQNAAMKKYLAGLGLNVPDLKADTVEKLLEEELPRTHKAYHALHLYSLVQFAAVKKIQSMLDSVCSDGWIRGMLLFYGAGTGRWSGRGVQPQNFKRPTIKNAEGVYKMICAGRSVAEIELIYGNVVDAISSCIRNFIQWSGGLLYDADYNAVEARIVCWLAGQLDRLADWAAGKDQYKMMAARIYGCTAEDIKNPSDEREVGKRAILGCGFSMAGEKFQKTCLVQYGIVISRELADKAVLAYRETHDRVQSFWWDCQRAAVKAIQNPGSVYPVGKVRFFCATVNGVLYLFLRLPSGRKIAYPYPKLERDPKREGSYTIKFVSDWKGGQRIWTHTYGGKLVENATQGVAADCMMAGSVEAERTGARIIMLVHDQAPALCEEALFTLEDYVTALTTMPDWASGLPLKAEGRIVPFYKK